jgi:hypothetical protein
MEMLLQNHTKIVPSFFLFVCWFVCFTVGAVLMVHNGTAVHQTCAEMTALFLYYHSTLAALTRIIL